MITIQDVGVDGGGILRYTYFFTTVYLFFIRDRFCMVRTNVNDCALGMKLVEREVAVDDPDDHIAVSGSWSGEPLLAWVLGISADIDCHKHTCAPLCMSGKRINLPCGIVFFCRAIDSTMSWPLSSSPRDLNCSRYKHPDTPLCDCMRIDHGHALVACEF